MRDEKLAPLIHQIDRRLEEMRTRAEQLLEHYRIPTTPPQPSPEKRVRMRALTTREFPGAEGRPFVLNVGQEFVTDPDTAHRYDINGTAEILGPAPPGVPAKRRPLMEGASAPFRKWSSELAEGKIPAEWRDSKVKLPSSKKRQKAVSALAYASIVKNLETAVDIAVEATSRLSRELGSSQDMRLLVESLHQVLLLFSHVDPEHVIQGSDRLEHLERVRPDQELMPGILAATKAVYRPGYTEAKTWKALQTVDGKTFDVDGRRYTVRMDDADGEPYSIYQVSEDAGEAGEDIPKSEPAEQSLKKSSFYRYFKVARDGTSGK